MTRFQNRNRFRAMGRHSQWRESLMAMMQPLLEDPDATEMHVGQRLQELRTMQGLSIRSLAELSGLNFNTLSLIENEKTSPNINTLQQLATALHVPITAFFNATSIYKDFVFLKADQRSRTSIPNGELQDLGGGMAIGEATPLLLTVEPNSNSGNEAIVHTGQEFVYCIEGTLVYWVGREECILEAGDSLIFQAHIPHRWENRGKCVSHSILIICPSDQSDRSVVQHIRNEINGV